MGITLAANGKQYSAWESISVTASIAEAARSFSIELAEDDLTLIEDPHWIAPGDHVDIFADGILILSGYVNEYKASFSATSHTVTVTGRSKAQDAIDCSITHKTGRFENLTVAQIASELASDIGLSITTDQTLAKIVKFQINQGETIFRAIDRLARIHGLAVMGVADGGMKITKASGDSYKTHLQQGNAPLLAATATVSDVKKFSQIEVKSQLSASKDRFGTRAAHEVSRVLDAAVKRFRPRVVIMESASSSAEAASRADWHARRMAGASTKIECECQGFHLGTELFEPNKRVYIESAMLKVDNEMLIESVVYSQDASGSKTKLSLVPAKAWTDKDKKKHKKSDTTTPGVAPKSGDTDFVVEDTTKSVPTPYLSPGWTQRDGGQF